MDRLPPPLPGQGLSDYEQLPGREQDLQTVGRAVVEGWEHGVGGFCSRPPPAPTLRLQQHRWQVRGPRGAASPQLCNCLLRLSSSTPSRQEGLFLSHAEHRPSRPQLRLCPQPRMLNLLPPSGPCLCPRSQLKCGLKGELIPLPFQTPPRLLPADSKAKDITSTENHTPHPLG